MLPARGANQQDDAARAARVAENVTEHVSDLPPHVAVAVPESIELLRATIDHRASFVESHLRSEDIIDLPELAEEDIVDVRESIERLQDHAARAGGA